MSMWPGRDSTRDSIRGPLDESIFEPLDEPGRDSAPEPFHDSSPEPAKGVSGNIFYLVLVQAITYLAPLITLPYLTRTLDVGHYALLGFTQAVIQYFVLVTDYGFGITATRLIAIDSRNKNAVSAVVANTLAVKLLLAIACALFSLLLMAVFSDLGENALLLAACFIGVLGNALFPTWLFQGLEKMQMLAFITCMSRLLPLPFFFLFVKTPDDVIRAAILQNIPGLLAAIASFYYLSQQGIVGRSAVSARTIKAMLQEGWPVFLSNMSTSFYTGINLILLKIFSGADQVAYFAATDKIRLAAQGFIQPIASALFPRIVALGRKAESAAASRALVLRGTVLLVALELAGGLVLYFGADLIARRYLGADFLAAAVYLKSLAFLPLIIAVATVISQWRFLALGESRVLSRIYLIAGPLHALYASYLTYAHQSSGLIASLYITEIGITLAMIAVAQRKQIPLL